MLEMSGSIPSIETSQCWNKERERQLQPGLTPPSGFRMNIQPSWLRNEGLEDTVKVML